MIVALKATGCAKVVNTQTESQMGKSHKHSTFPITLVRCPHSIRDAMSSYRRKSTGNNYSALLCLRRAFGKQINSERFSQTEQNAAPELSGGEVSCWRRPVLWQTVGIMIETRTRKQTSQIMWLHQQSTKRTFRSSVSLSPNTTGIMIHWNALFSQVPLSIFSK